MKRFTITIAALCLISIPAVAQDEPVGAPQVAPVAAADPQASFDQALELLERNPFPTEEILNQVQPLLDIAYRGGVTRVEVPYNLGVIALRRNKLQDAVRFLNDAKVLDPADADIIAMLGMVASKQGRDAEAEALVQEALALNEYSSIALNFLADKEVRARNFEQALVLCRKGLLGNPDNLDSYLNMAIVYYETDRLELGELVCQSALKINKEAAPIRNLLGLVYLKQNEVRKAFSEFERAVTADPGYMDARKNLAALVLNYKDYPAAVSQFEEALKLEPDNLQLRLSYAVALRGVENFDAARTELEGILAKRPGHPEASYNLCILLHEYLEAYEDALRQCADFQARIDKKHPKWREMNQRVKGIKETIEVLKEFPEEPPAPAGEAPAEAAPAEAVPAEAVPAEAVPAEAAPAEAVPAEAAPAESDPSREPATEVPAESAPAEAAPAEAPADTPTEGGK